MLVRATQKVFRRIGRTVLQREIVSDDSRNLRQIIEIISRGIFRGGRCLWGGLGSRPRRPWESAQPCRVSGQSREKCSVRNLGGRREKNASHLPLPLFSHIQEIPVLAEIKDAKAKKKRKPLQCKQEELLATTTRSGIHSTLDSTQWALRKSNMLKVSRVLVSMQ